MVVLDTFYQISERRTSTISSFWKVAHTLACIVSAVCGFLTAFAFGQILSDFNYNCVIKAKIVFDNSSFLNSTGWGVSKQVHAIDATSTMWGKHSDCDFAQFTPLVIMISAIIWGTYFVVMSKGGAGYATDLLGKPWSSIYPCIFFTTIFFIVYVISTDKLKHGLQDFCREFKPEFNNTMCVPEINVYSSQFYEQKNVFFDFYLSTLIAFYSSAVGIWSWVFQLILCVTRVCCVADFDLQLVMVETKEEEVVENIIEFSDLRIIDEVSEV